MSSDDALRAFISTVQPVLLVGGKSRRFGRDKLLEPLGAGPETLVDRPLAALRAVFGPRVLGVGQCDPAVAARLDSHINDQHPGAGPAAGILAALRSHAGPVFVLAGDMPHVTAPAVRRILERAHAAARPSSAPPTSHPAAVLARTHELQPCFGVYFPAAAEELQRGLAATRPRSLHETLAHLATVAVSVEASEAANVNTVGDWAGEFG